MIMGIEFAKGGTIQDLMHRRYKDKRQFSDEECAKIIKGILQGL